MIVFIESGSGRVTTVSDTTYFILAMIFNYGKYAIAVIVFALMVSYCDPVAACGYGDESETQTTVNCAGCK